MSLIRPPVVQTHLRVARELDLVLAAAVIDKRYRANLRIGIRHDTNGTVRFDLAIAVTELGAVGVKIEVVVIAVRERLTAGRPAAAVLKIAQITELAPAVACCIFSPAGHVQVTPYAVARPGARDHHAVRAV